MMSASLVVSPDGTQACSDEHDPQVLAVRIARTFRQRLWGIRAWPDWGITPWGLLLPYCSSIHTAGLKHPIDVVFVSRDGDVLAVCQQLAPWRCAGHRGAWGTLELPSGYCSGSGWADRVSDAWGALKIEV